MIRLLAIDIDGTLLNSRHEIPEANIAALADVSARGIEVALVTGRNFHFTLPVARQLPIPLSFILNNGAVVKDGAGTTLIRHVVERDVARAILTHTREYEDSVAVVFDRPDERQILYEHMDWTHVHRRGYYAKNQAFITAASPLDATLTEDPIQVMFNGSVAAMRRLVDELQTMPERECFAASITEYEARDFSLIDVNGPGCSKGTTLAEWASVRGLTASEVMAVGDNLNDVEMLNFAGVPVLMGNAADALKTRGWHLTGTNDEAGLAMAIRRMLA